MAKRRDLIRMTAEEVDAFLHGRRVMNIATHNHELARKADRGYRLVDGRAVAWP